MQKEPLEERAKSVGRGLVRRVGHATSGLRMTPDFLIVGAQRCGTTSLFRGLAEHPSVVPPLMHKGVHFFDTPSAYARGMRWYRGHFPLRAIADRRAHGRAMTGEASPYYMFHPLGAERIATALPTARLIVLLRDPVERAFSAYKQETTRGFETETFEHALELEPKRLFGEVERLVADPGYYSFAHQHHAYLARGEYAAQLERLVAALGNGRVLVIFADHLFAPPTQRDTWQRILAYLDLPAWEPRIFPHANAKPSAPMQPELRRRLDGHFAALDQRLAALLGETPPWRR
jgi:Sulfotransferase family